ncbi:arginyl-tRNA--protein arginylyltransferase [Cytophagaceae bacterium ABcell3]|nr:arginyl-tRNA--protein arginylyltransferase [Cytophagaceae bacterium ABcell3]
MFAQAHFPLEPLQAEELDSYLSQGWFRMYQYIFTCTYLPLNDQVYRVHWLRVVLDEFENSKTSKKLFKLNSKFSVSIQKTTVTPEKEALYHAYQNAIPFETAPSLDQLLYDDFDFDIFDTLEITVYDRNKLIAVGFFDMGKNSAAGITSFYDPAYKKYSLGKYLIYQKMLYCKKLQTKYFYLGYVAPGAKAFDYKLDIAKNALEYYDLSTQKWLDIKLWNPQKGSIEENKQKLLKLQQQLSVHNIENRLFHYAYFQGNLFPQLQDLELFDYLMFVNCFDFCADTINPLVVYDFRDQHYHLLKCCSMGESEEPEVDEDVYSFRLLKTEEVLFSTPCEKEMAKALQHISFRIVQ